MGKAATPPTAILIGSHDWHKWWSDNDVWPINWVDVYFTIGLGLTTEEHNQLKEDIAQWIESRNLQSANFKSDSEAQRQRECKVKDLIKTWQAKMVNPYITIEFINRAMNAEILRVRARLNKRVKTEVKPGYSTTSGPSNTGKKNLNDSGTVLSEADDTISYQNSQAQYITEILNTSSLNSKQNLAPSNALILNPEMVISTFADIIQYEHMCLIREVANMSMSNCKLNIDDLEYSTWLDLVSEDIGASERPLEAWEIWYMPRQTEAVKNTGRTRPLQIKSAVQWHMAFRFQLSVGMSCFEFYLIIPDDPANQQVSTAQAIPRNPSNASALVISSDEEGVESSNSKRRRFQSPIKSQGTGECIDDLNDFDQVIDPAESTNGQEGLHQESSDYNQLILSLQEAPKCEHLSVEEWVETAALFGIDAHKYQDPKQMINLFGFKVPVYPYQLRGAAYLFKNWSSTVQFSVLADEMGWGKSVQFLIAVYLNWTLIRMRWHFESYPASHYLPESHNSSTDDPIRCPWYGEYLLIPCPCIPNSPTAKSGKWQPRIGPVLLIVPATLLSSWIKDFNKFIDSKSSRLTLLVAHNSNISGTHADPTVHGKNLLANADGQAIWDQSRILVLTSQESYKTQVEAKFIKPRQKPRLLNAKATESAVELAKKEASIHIRWSIVARDEFHLQHQDNAGTVAIFKGFFWLPWLCLISGTPMRGDAARLINYIQCLPWSSWKRTSYERLMPERLRELNTELKQVSKQGGGIQDSERIMTLSKSLHEALQLIMIRRTEDSLWFGHPCKALTKMIARDVGLFMSPTSLDQLNSFFRGEVQSDMSSRMKTWREKGSKGESPVIDQKALSDKSRLTRIYATFPKLKDFHMMHPELTFTQKDMLGNQGSSNFILYDDTIHYKALDSLIAENPKINWLETFINGIMVSYDEAGRRDKVILFSEFPNTAWRIYQWLELRWPRETCYLHHKVPVAKRIDKIEPFNEPLDENGQLINPWQPRILLSTIGIGGTGFNMVRARHVVLLDYQRDPGVRDQAFRRAAREGNLNENCYVYQLYIEGLDADDLIRDRVKLDELLIKWGMQGTV